MNEKYVPAVAAMLSWQLERKGYSKENPCKVKSNLYLTVEGVGQVEYVVSAVYPEEGTIIVIGKKVQGIGDEREVARKAVSVKVVNGRLPWKVREENPEWADAKSLAYDVNVIARALYRKKVVRPVECDFLSVYSCKNAEGKETLWVDLGGFIWEDEGKWHVVDIRNACVPLSEFLEKYDAKESAYTDSLQSGGRQWEDDVSARTAFEEYLSRYGGAPADEYINPSKLADMVDPIGNYSF